MTFDDTFRADVWNVFNGTDADRIAHVMAREITHGVDAFLMCEAGGKDIDTAVRRLGMETYAFDQYRVVWSPKRWPHVISTRGVRLAATPWYARRGTRANYVGCAEVIVSDDYGCTGTLVAYHMPPHTQKDMGARGYPKRRYAGFIEGLTGLGELAAASRSTWWLSGGDDNWDEDTGPQTKDTRPIMLGAETGLRQLQAGVGTYKAREIDDFRLPRTGALRPVGGPAVRSSGAAENPAHKIQSREFRIGT